MRKSHGPIAVALLLAAACAPTTEVTNSWKDPSAGSVRFRSLARGGTQLDVRLQYAPPGGRLGASVAWLLGSSPAAQVREALRQLKQVLETGEVPTVEGQPSGGRSAGFSAVKSIA